MPDNTRLFFLNELPEKRGPVIYWMQRDQRVADNWALIQAQETAIMMKQPLAVVFCLVPGFLDATLRQYDFMLNGLKEVESMLGELSIPLFILQGEPQDVLPKFLEHHNAGLLVTDFNPLQISLQWKETLVQSLTIPFIEVDAHNIIPCRIASEKQEFSARTFRIKVNRQLQGYLSEFPAITRHPLPWKNETPPIPWRSLFDSLRIDLSVKQVENIIPGENAAMQALNHFINLTANNFAADRNFPEKNGQSGLSPYLHFGQISAQRVALKVLESDISSENKSSFLEELIVRRELADNYCFYNGDYDRFAGLPAWARKSLDEHRRDRREHIYPLETYESAGTHDELWNAAQKEMMFTGKMHGYMRMYWAKKILEWSLSPEEAQAIAIYLNDKYELDGRDPNGYAGIAWSIGGLHDRPWKKRPVFGTIRYMNYQGCLRKFDVKAYISRMAKVSSRRP